LDADILGFGRIQSAVRSTPRQPGDVVTAFAATPPGSRVSKIEDACS
jgi:hypothetical protein